METRKTSLQAEPEAIDERALDEEVDRLLALSDAELDRELENAGIVAPSLNDDLLKVSLECMIVRDTELREMYACRNDLMLRRKVGLSPVSLNESSP